MGKAGQSTERDITASFLRNYDLVSLRLLLTAIDEGNLARVAAREDISLSAVSRRISDLEARIGVKLLHRHDRGVSPTDAAQSNVARLRSLFDQIDQLVESFRAIRDGETGVVRLRAHMTAVTGALPEAIAAFAAEHDGIELIVDEATSVEIVHSVQVGDCDIGFVSGTVETNGLVVYPWMTDELAVVMPADHPLRGREALRFADVLDHPFIGMMPGSALLTLFRGQAAAIGRSLDERARVSAFEGVREMVVAGVGIGILPAVIASRMAAQGVLAVRRLDEEWAARSLVICVRNRSHLSGAARLFLDHLLN